MTDNESNQGGAGNTRNAYRCRRNLIPLQADKMSPRRLEDGRLIASEPPTIKSETRRSTQGRVDLMKDKRNEGNNRSEYDKEGKNSGEEQAERMPCSQRYCDDHNRAVPMKVKQNVSRQSGFPKMKRSRRTHSTGGQGTMLLQMHPVEFERVRNGGSSSAITDEMPPRPTFTIAFFARTARLPSIRSSESAAESLTL